MHKIDRKYQLLDSDVANADIEDIKEFLKDYLSQSRYPYYSNKKDKLAEVWPRALDIAGNPTSLTLYRGLAAPANDRAKYVALVNTIKDAERGFYRSDKISYWASDAFTAQMSADIFIQKSLRVIFSIRIQPNQAIKVSRILPDKDEYVLPPGQYRIKIFKIEES